MNILNEYWNNLPSPQQVVDIFKGEWSSRLPDLQGVKIESGQAELFNDQRIHLLNDYFPLQGKNILELGPLEGGHTFMMHQMGAHITAVEANSRAYLKCLIVKELYQLERVHLLGGDALAYMQNCQSIFDLCVASGILYHSTHPGIFIEACCQVSNRVFVWTHYFDEQLMPSYANLNGRFEPMNEMNLAQVNFPAWRFYYRESLDWKGFCGGQQPFSTWIRKQDIIRLFEAHGFNQIHVFFDDHSHPLGPNICFIAEKNH